MIDLPQAFLQQLQAMLGNEYGRFLNNLQTEAPVSIRYNRKKQADIPPGEMVAWCDSAIYLPQRPTFTLDPLLHSGVYYVQEAASMFIEQAVKQLPFNTTIRALDLCAAPGGKSTHLIDCMPEGSLLVSNEVIRNRVNILAENLSKWGHPHTVVSHNDPKDFNVLPSFFDLVLIDAPCSGEGMFRKDPAAIREWSPANVTLCAERQRRIISDVWDSLKENGYLIYSTCTYNRQENEENIQWIKKHLGADLIRIPLQADWQIYESESGYRFFPHHTKGEGFFISLLQKTSSSPQNKKGKVPVINTMKQFPNWFAADMTVVRQDNFLQAWPTAYLHDIAFLKQQLRVIQAGISTGELKGNDIVPHTAVALSTAIHSEAFPRIALTLEEALHFLHRDSLKLPLSGTGYYIPTYNEHALGFIKHLGTRSNNLYPTHWRIRMDIV